MNVAPLRKSKKFYILVQKFINYSYELIKKMKKIVDSFCRTGKKTSFGRIFADKSIIVQTHMNVNIINFLYLFFIDQSNECPLSYKWAFNNGRHCCKFDKEKDKGRAGCEGNKITQASTCCWSNRHIRCPHDGGCVNAGNVVSTQSV